jgi:D-amino-acid oxidase
VQILAEAFAQQTNSGAAGAIWFPYDVEPFEKVIAWSLSSYAKFRELAREPQSGVSFIELRQLARVGEISIPAWADEMDGRTLGPAEIPSAFASGFALRVPLIDTTRYLDYLRERFVRAGGRLRQRHVTAFSETAGEFDLIINCAGIGARELAADSGLEPHRGQVVIVPKLDLDHAVVCDDTPFTYAIPRRNDCLFGGTNELSDDIQPNRSQTATILAECSRVLSINQPPVLAERVGIRPFRRSGVRLEREQFSDGCVVVHNYGHGGAGFTLSWGCAEEVLTLADQA